MVIQDLANMLGNWPMRRWFRILWCILAVGLLVALPLIVVEFKRTGFALHYEVRQHNSLCQA